MGKTWEMKKRILKILAKRTRTSGEISEMLNIAPPTVSVHLKELENMGAIIRVDNDYAKKWKYYKVKPGFDIDKALKVKNTNIIPLIFMGVAIVLIAVGALIFFGLTQTIHTQTSLMEVWLTDPPQVPQGTQALLVSYSSLQVHIANTSNKAGWVTSNATGIVNLMSLVNTSELIGYAKLPANSVPDMVRFNITGAKAVINSTTYNVNVPERILTMAVRLDNTTGRAGTISILLDINTTITPVHTTNVAGFTLLTSSKAIDLNAQNANKQEQVGSTEEINVSVQNELRHGGKNQDAGNT